MAKVKIEIKKCNKHGDTEHGYYSGGSSKMRWRCKKCQVDAVKKRRAKVKIKALNYKGGKCLHCGYNKYEGALQFHHIDSENKSFGISQKGHCRSWKKVKKELDKCILLCGNCHSELHGGLIDVEDLIKKTDE